MPLWNTRVQPQPARTPPRIGAMFVLIQASSMNTSLRGSICCYRARQRTRLCAMSGRFCSATRAAFKSQSLGGQEHLGHPTVDLHPLAASSAANPRSVQRCSDRIRRQSQAGIFSVTAARLYLPILLDRTASVLGFSLRHFDTHDRLIRRVAPIAQMACPFSASANTRSRKSSKYGCVIRAGLECPIPVLNQNSLQIGI